jgi:putative addiction module killer protein
MKAKLRLKQAEEYKTWLLNLDPFAKAEIIETIWDIRRSGQLPGPQKCKMLKAADGIFELVYDFVPGYRVYFCRCGKMVYLLLYGGVKKTQRADVAKAKIIKKHELGE